MFKELTQELLDLTGSAKGFRNATYALTIECCSCSSCGCLFFCGS